MVIDPVCQMEINEETPQHRSEYEGKTYYFCAAGCKKTFDENPQMFLSKGDKS